MINLKKIENRWHWGSTVYFIDPEGGIVCVEFMDGTDWGYICSLQVCQENMKSGIATRLMSESEHIILQKGFDLVTLAVEKTKPEWLIDWYLRLGYEQYDEDEHLLYFRKDLS